MGNTTPDNLRGLLIPKVNITKDNIWKAQSTFTQQNPRAGLAKPSQSYTGLSLAMAGTQSEEVTIKTLEGGAPGEKASFGFSIGTGSDLGKNCNNVITDWKYLNFTSTIYHVINSGRVHNISSYILILLHTYSIHPIPCLYPCWRESPKILSKMMHRKMK